VATGVTLGGQRIEASTVLWAAGVRASPLVAALGVETDRAGRVPVEPDCALPGHPEAFCIGDAAVFIPAGTETPLPGTSPVAMQQGRFVARAIKRAIEGETRETFAYVDKGSMATIGRSRAVAEIGRVRLGGFLAWMAWLVVHIFYLMGFQSRLFVTLKWVISFFNHGRTSRLIADDVPLTDRASDGEGTR